LSEIEYFLRDRQFLVDRYSKIRWVRCAVV
jgi:hypothetical protein